MRTPQRQVCTACAALVLKRSLSCAKITQTSGKRTCSQFPECGLSYTKITQTRGKKVYFQFPECSLSYAKIVQIERNAK